MAEGGYSSWTKTRTMSRAAPSYGSGREPMQPARTPSASLCHRRSLNRPVPAPKPSLLSFSSTITALCRPRNRALQQHGTHAAFKRIVREAYLFIQKERHE
ncbi:hypothetical protein L227DRAFT_147532 [Lentinus tigrinus ALCF2SS1-6]|uniref:Uncharacterized protein n=1 Tax=Lentinus tigrinus ALCF2SS1-6 TaxID=1328759 RepID=A0A5C2T217_9APHY|nr:hypothetical protein L227DRAFT_147532 [Lentinus tigrinus ALCF2SS1-6]